MSTSWHIYLTIIDDCKETCISLTISNIWLARNTYVARRLRHPVEEKVCDDVDMLNRELIASHMSIINTLRELNASQQMEKDQIID